MDTLEYRKLITTLDEQLERVKREAEFKRKREEVEQHIKLVVHQITSLEARKAEFEKFGVKPPLDIDTVIARLRKEKVGFETQLNTADEQAEETRGDGRLQGADRDEIVALTEEARSSNPATMTEVERWTLFEIWATRWRIVLDRAGSATADSYYMKRAYAVIVEIVKSFKTTDQGWYIDALDKAKSGPGYNWEARLDACHRRLTELLETRKKERDAEAAEAKAIELLETSIASYAQNSTDETYRALCHGIRQAARFEHLREDVAGMVSGWKERFGEEFAFLWQNGKVEEPVARPDDKVTNKEIIRRILHRLRSKGCIGASHAPVEKMWKGFPNHDQARAKDGLELLVKNGVIRRKNTGIGPRVSVETGMVMKVDAFFQGKDLGVKPIDDWCREV